MFVWSVLALCAIGATSGAAPLTDSVGVSETIPFSAGRGQLFSSSADLIASYRREQPTAPELPAVIPISPSKQLEVPVSSASESISTGTPPRPVFNRSMRLRVDLSTLDRSDAFEVEYHAESNTARTEVDDYTFVYRWPAGQGHVQFLKSERARILNVQNFCTKSPPLPAGPEDSALPGLPNLEPFNFAGYKTEDGRKVEHWQHVVVGKPGGGGAAKGESLNFTHDFFVYRDGQDAVPLRYTVTTDSSVLGAGSDTYTHRYTPLPPPTAPLIPDVNKICDQMQDYQAKRRRRYISLSREEFIWLIKADKEQVHENTKNDLAPEARGIVWSY